MSAVAASAGKNDSIASSDSVTSTGVPKIVVVENSDSVPASVTEAQRHDHAGIFVVHVGARGLRAAGRRIGGELVEQLGQLRRPP